MITSLPLAVEFSLSQGCFLTAGAAKVRSAAWRAPGEECIDRLGGKVAIITGGGSGIGAAACRLFAEEGASVVAGVHSAEDGPALDRAVGEGAGPLTWVEADVSREEDCARLVATAVARYGGLDILFCNAGRTGVGTVETTSDERWQAVLDVNLKSILFCCRHAVPAMRKRGCGSIVINASINGIRGNRGMVAYAASKGGAVALTRALAMDHAAENIRVNCLCPGTISTRMVERYLAEVENPVEAEREIIGKHPLGRLGRAEEVACAALFLASDEASFITGVVLPVDGGRHIR